jgi:hypothetical protein
MLGGVTKDIFDLPAIIIVVETKLCLSITSHDFNTDTLAGLTVKTFISYIVTRMRA